MHHGLDGNLERRRFNGSGADAPPDAQHNHTQHRRNGASTSAARTQSHHPGTDRWKERPLSIVPPSRPGGEAPHPNPHDPGALDHTALLAFFAERGRDLPWRRPEAGPWAVMVSEFMLQQTPVVRVLPVFDLWIQRWPSPADLAADSPGDAVRAWGRLGYPRRALRLHAAATTITNDHEGRVPSGVDVLMSLPGVGEYTARAIAAFAFRSRTPVVDTNVRRVLSRAVRGLDSIREAATPADRRELETLLPSESEVAAKFSAAVMELGALICTANNPDCSDCPVLEKCAWRAAGYPKATARRPVQTWAGTDRQVRGRIMALLRASTHPVMPAAVDVSWPDAQQRDRCVASLVVDGLAVRLPDGALALPS